MPRVFRGGATVTMMLLYGSWSFKSVEMREERCVSE